MWVMLAGALAVLSPARRLAIILLLCATLAGFFTDTLRWPALLPLAVSALLVWLRVENPARRGLQVMTETALLLTAGGLFLHLWPGFQPLLQVDNMQAGPRSLPFSFAYHFDKALIPFVLLACLPTLFRTRPFPPRHISAWLLLLAAIPLLLYVAVCTGGLAPERHWPAWLGRFMLANLFFVALAEEALFRGYLQQRLRQRLGNLPALLLASLLFGVAHVAGGALLVLFATLAGVIYGLAWHWSGRLWVAAGVHFLFNLTHLLWFTYPALQH